MLLVLLLAGCSANSNTTSLLEVEYQTVPVNGIIEKVERSKNLYEYMSKPSSPIGVVNDHIYYDQLSDMGKMDIFDLANFSSDEPMLNTLFSTEDYSIWLGSEIINNAIYLPAIKDGSAFALDIIKVGLDGSSDIIYSVPSSIGLPTVYFVGEHIIISTTHNNKTRIVDYNSSSLESTIVKETSYFKASDGKRTGEFILYGGSLEPSGFYYELIELDNEDLEAAGQSNIFFYSFDDHSESLVLQPDEKSLFVTGDDEFILISEYELENPARVSGKLYHFSDKLIEVSEIPEISPGYDLFGAKKIKNYIVAFNQKDIFFIDTSAQRYSIYSYRNDTNYNVYDDDNPRHISSAILSDDIIYYFEFSNTSTQLVTIYLA